MTDEQMAKCLNDLINIVNEHNEALIKLLDKLDEFDMRLKALEDKQKSVITDDFIIAAGPRRSGKTTELIKEVCKINQTEGRNVAVIMCWSQAEARNIASKADDLGFHDMPFPITVEEIRQIRRGGGHGRGCFYKYAIVNDLDRIAQALISPLCLQLRGFSYTLPNKEGENEC